MAVTFVSIARPRHRKTQKAGNPFGKMVDKKWTQTPEQKSRETKHREALAKAVKSYADNYMQKMDKNGDGFIAKSEMPDIVRMWHYRRLDRNRDEVVTRAEVEQAASERLYSSVPR